MTQDQFDALQARRIRLEPALRRLAKKSDVAQDYEKLVDRREIAATLCRLARNALDDA